MHMSWDKRLGDEKMSTVSVKATRLPVQYNSEEMDGKL